MRQSVLGALVVAMVASSAGASAQDAAVVVARDLLPPSGAAWRGDGPHVFLAGEALLTCSSHGGFSSAAEPPRRAGTPATREYTATFVGELALARPGAERTVHPIDQVVRMAESARLVGSGGAVRWFTTKLSVFELGGAGMPDGVIVRESPERTSAGRTTITALRSGGYRVDGFLDVWLEISLDGGRSWHAAEAPVRMTLVPERPRRVQQ